MAKPDLESNISHFYHKNGGGLLPQEGPIEPFQAWKLRILPHEDFTSLSPEAGLAYLVAWGLLAPSTHNVNPVMYSLDTETNSIGISLNKHRILRESDPTGKQSAISAGTAVTNIQNAAEYYGLQTVTKIRQEQFVRPHDEDSQSELLPLATLAFSPNVPTTLQRDSRIMQTMLDRRVIRAEFHSTPLDPHVVRDMQQLVNDRYSDVQLHIVTDMSGKQELAKIQELADNDVWNREGFTRELGNFLLPNDSESPVGMRGRDFGIMSDAQALHMHWGLLGKEQLLPDEIARIVAGSKLTMRNSGGIGILTSATDTLASWMIAGEAYEATALELLQKHTLYTSVHAGMTEVPSTTRRLKHILRTNESPLVVFRIGTPEDQQTLKRPHSSRPSLQSVIFPYK